MARPKVQTHGFDKKFRYVRTELGFSHEKVAQLSGGVLDRIEVGRIESGKNKVSSNEAREALAKALSVPRLVLDSALAGKIGADELLTAARDGAKRKTLPPQPLEAAPMLGAPAIVNHAHPSMRWRATLELVDTIEEGEALRAMLKVQDLSPDATWGDYYAAAKKTLGVDYKHDPSVPPPSRAPRVNRRTQKRR